MPGGCGDWPMKKAETGWTTYISDVCVGGPASVSQSAHKEGLTWTVLHPGGWRLSRLPASPSRVNQVS